VKICIHKKLLGTDQHLIVDQQENTFTWSNRSETDLWTIGDKSCLLSISALSEAMRKKISLSPGGKWDRQFFEIYDVDTMDQVPINVPWSKILPPDVFKGYVKSVIQKAQEVFEDENAKTYSETLKNTRNSLLNLKRASIDVSLWSANKNGSDNGQKSTVESFRPDADGFAQPIVYKKGDATGRLSIESGPKILHLKKEYRNMIKSRWEGGRILQADYVSLEPRILLSLVGKTPDDDVYTHVMNTALKDVDITRKEAKIIVMGVLYGIGDTKLQSMLGSTINASVVMSKVKEHFNVSALEYKLKKEYDECGFVRNHYGRILNPSRSDGPGLISYHVQSTGVDLALQGFNKLIKHIQKYSIKVAPIMIIHDAILLDVHPEVDEYTLNEIIQQGTQIEGFDNNFPMEVKDA